jgi:hypothetical protein
MSDYRMIVDTDSPNRICQTRMIVATDNHIEYVILYGLSVATIIL